MENPEKKEKNPIALLVDPETEKSLGGVKLMGDPVPANEWICASGDLQSFELIGDRNDLWPAWMDQQELFLRTDAGQQRVRIITYPAEGETQGYLDLLSPFELFPAKSKSRISTLRGLAFIQSLLGT